MTGLQEAFYIVALVYMGISLLILIGVIAAVFVIRAKIVSLENMVKEKVEAVASISSKAAGIVGKAAKFVNRKAQ